MIIQIVTAYLGSILVSRLNLSMSAASSFEKKVAHPIVAGDEFKTSGGT